MKLSDPNLSIFFSRFITKAVLLTLALFYAGAFVNTPAQEADIYRQWAAKPPSMADYPLEFAVVSERDTVAGVPQFVGWTPVLRGRILGRTASGDAVLIELAQNGKLLTTLRARLSGNNGQTWFDDWEIRGEMSKHLLTAVGPMTATFKYVESSSDKITTLGVRQLSPVRIAAWEDAKNVWKYGALYDDLLGFSYLVQRQADTGPGFVWIYTWMNLEHDSAVKDLTYRLEVDGQPVALAPAFDANQNHESVATLDQYEEVFIKAKNDRVVNRHNMYLVAFRPKLLWGKKNETPATGGALWLADHPGKWVFKIRIEGNVVRELHFTVANGEIQPHPEQDTAKPGYLNLGPGRFFAETYFPNPNAFDVRFDPAPIRAGVLYGRPWISTEVKEGMLKTLPPKNPGTMVFPQPGP